MDRYRVRAYRTEALFVRRMPGVDEEFVTHQLLAECGAQRLLKTKNAAIVTIHRAADDWLKQIRPGLPPTGRGNFLVFGDLDQGDDDE